MGASTHNRAYWLQLFLHCMTLHTQRVQSVRLEKHSASATVSVLQSATCLPLSRGSVRPAPLAVSVPLTCTSLETSACPRTAAPTLSLVGSHISLSNSLVHSLSNLYCSLFLCIIIHLSVCIYQILLTVTLPDAIPVVDKCSQYEDCSECILSDPDCQWCPYLPVCVIFIYSLVIILCMPLLT